MNFLQHAGRAIFGTRKRRHAPQSDDDDRDGDGGGGSSARPGGSRVPLLAMPNEVLVMILHRIGDYKHVTELRRVCKRFDEVCSETMRDAFRNTLSDLVDDIALAKLLYDTAHAALLANPPNGFPYVFAGQTCMRRQIDGICQLQGLESQLRLVKATVWPYATAGVCTFYDGGLINAYRRVRRKIMAHTRTKGYCECVLKSTMTKVRRHTALYIRAFSQRVNVYLNNPVNDLKRAAMLTGISILEMLESCAFCEADVPTVCRDGARQGYARLRLKYSLNNSWLRIMFSRALQSRANSDELSRELLSVIQELIWTSNHEYYSWEAQERYARLKMNEYVHHPVETKIHLRRSIEARMNNSFFNAIEVRDDHFFNYGHLSKFYDTDYISEDFHVVQQVPFDGQIVYLPKLTRHAVLELHVEITCHGDLLPRAVLARAVREEEVLARERGKTYALCINVMSREFLNEGSVPRWYQFTSEVEEDEKEPFTTAPSTSGIQVNENVATTVNPTNTAANNEDTRHEEEPGMGCGEMPPCSGDDGGSVATSADKYGADDLGCGERLATLEESSDDTIEEDMGEPPAKVMRLTSPVI